MDGDSCTAGARYAREVVGIANSRVANGASFGVKERQRGFLAKRMHNAGNRFEAVSLRRLMRNGGWRSLCSTCKRVFREREQVGCNWSVILVKNGKAAAAPVVAPAGQPRCWVSVGCAAGGDGRDAIAVDAAEIPGEVEV